MLLELVSAHVLDGGERVLEVVLELAQVLELADVVGDLLLVSTFEFRPTYWLLDYKLTFMSVFSIEVALSTS